MIARLGLILLLFGLFGDTVAEQGREGNAHFREREYAAAAGAYRKALSAVDDSVGAIFSGLQNNLGLALQRQQKYGGAWAAYDRALRSASSAEDSLRALFNGANVAAALGDREKALENYRRVLLLDPSHEAARFNYEYLKRNTGEGTFRQRPSVEPSAYAQRLKRKAETLVTRRQYTAAAALMKDGSRQDSTVSAYREFIRRIEEVARISRSEP